MRKYRTILLNVAIRVLVAPMRGVYAVMYESGPCGSGHISAPGVHLGFGLFRPTRCAMYGDGRSDRDAKDRVPCREFHVEIRHGT